MTCFDQERRDESDFENWKAPAHWGLPSRYSGNSAVTLWRSPAVSFGSLLHGPLIPDVPQLRTSHYHALHAQGHQLQAHEWAQLREPPSHTQRTFPTYLTCWMSGCWAVPGSSVMQHLLTDRSTILLITAITILFGSIRWSLVLLGSIFMLLLITLNSSTGNFFWYMILG